jgi:hypothetical protein
MRRLLILVSAIVALVTTVPMAVLGQEATPEPGTALALTDTRYVIPFGPDGLTAGLTARETLTGTCTADSITVSDRADAFNCLGEDSQFYDPCFENPFSPRDEPGEVACIPDPLSSEVVLLTVADPLPREKEAPADQGQDPFAPWDLPWALELANGDRSRSWGERSTSSPDRLSTTAASRMGPFWAWSTTANRSGLSTTWPMGILPPTSSTSGWPGPNGSAPSADQVLNTAHGIHDTTTGGV